MTLSDDEAMRMLMSAARFSTWEDDDALARRLGLTYQVRQLLDIRSIGSTDVDRAGRNRFWRERGNAAKRKKRAEMKQEPAMQTETAPKNLTPKEGKVLARIDTAEIAVPELVKRVIGLKEFCKLAEPRRVVHKIIDRLVAVGLVTEDYQPGPKGMPVRYVCGVDSDRARCAEA